MTQKQVEDTMKNEPTRITPDTRTLIDLLVTTRPELIIKKGGDLRSQPSLCTRNARRHLRSSTSEILNVLKKILHGDLHC